eukprot:m.376286 g.376286  ORF g.376286 m.376286 type:complete len:51 (-) comp82846_c0_seq1:62-214(-)
MCIFSFHNVEKTAQRNVEQLTPSGKQPFSPFLALSCRRCHHLISASDGLP